MFNNSLATGIAWSDALSYRCSLITIIYIKLAMWLFLLNSSRGLSCSLLRLCAWLSCAQEQRRPKINPKSFLTVRDILAVLFTGRQDAGRAIVP